MMRSEKHREGGKLGREPFGMKNMTEKSVNMKRNAGYSIFNNLNIEQSRLFTDLIITA